jgi:hypothetical protein
VFEGSGTFSSASQPRGVLTEKVGDRSGTPIRERTGNRLLVLFDSGDEVTVQAGEEGMRFLLVSGKPIEEPVAWYGPIVMNTEAELTLGAMRPSRPHKVRPQQSSFCGPPVNVMVWTAPAPASGSIESCAKMVVVEQPSEGAPSMGKSITDLSSVTTVGLDLAKHWRPSRPRSHPCRRRESQACDLAYRRSEFYLSIEPVSRRPCV